MFQRILFCTLVGLLLSPLAHAQTSTPVPTPEATAACESMVRETYQGLVREQLLTEDTGSTVWAAQLTALSKKLRTLTTQYTVRRQQAESSQMQMEQTIAQLIDQTRDLNQRLLQLMTAQGVSTSPPAGTERPKE